MTRHTWKHRPLAHLLITQITATQRGADGYRGSLGELPEEIPNDIWAAGLLLAESPAEQEARIRQRLERLPMALRQVMSLRAQCSSLNALAARLGVSIDIAEMQVAAVIASLRSGCELEWMQLEKDWKRETAKRFAWRRILAYVSRAQETIVRNDSETSED